MVEVNVAKAISFVLLVIVFQQCSLRYIPANFRYSSLNAGKKDDDNKDINEPCNADDELGQYGSLGCDKNDRSKASHDMLRDASSNSKSSDTVAADSELGNEFTLEEPMNKQGMDDTKGLELDVPISTKGQKEFTLEDPGTERYIGNVEEFKLDMPAATNDDKDSGTRNEFSLDEPNKHLHLGEELKLKATADLHNTNDLESQNDFNLDESKKEENIDVNEFKVNAPISTKFSQEDTTVQNEFKLEEPKKEEDFIGEMKFGSVTTDKDRQDPEEHKIYNVDEPKKDNNVLKEFTFNGPDDLQDTKDMESKNEFKKEENLDVDELKINAPISKVSQEDTRVQNEFKLEEPKKDEDFIGEMKFGSVTKDNSNERQGPEEHKIFSLDKIVESKEDLPVEELKFNIPEDLQNTKDLEAENNLNLDVSKREKNLEVDELNDFKLEEHQAVSEENKNNDVQNDFQLDEPTEDSNFVEELKFGAPDVPKSTRSKGDLETQGDFKLDDVGDAPITMADSHEDITKEHTFTFEEPEHKENLGDEGLKVEHKFTLDEPTKENLDVKNEFKLDAPYENDVSNDFNVGDDPMSTNLYDSKEKTSDKSALQTNPEGKSSESDDPFTLPESDILDEDTGDNEGERHVVDEQNLEKNDGNGNMMDIFSDEPDTNLGDIEDSLGIEHFFQ